MKILHLATTYPLHEADSSAAFVEALVENLCRRGHQVDVLLPYHPQLVLQRAARRARLHAFRATPFKSWCPWGYAQALTGDRSLRWDAYAATPFAVLSAIHALRRLLAHTRFDVVHANWLVPAGPIVAQALRGRCEPMVVSCHGSGVFLAERRSWIGAAARRSLDRATALTACSRDLTQRAAAFGNTVEAQWIPYGVDIDTFRPAPDQRDDERAMLARRFGIAAAAPWVLAVGRLVYKKGFENLVRGMATVRAHVPQAQLIIAGAGPLAEQLRDAAARSGVADALHLVGAVAHSDLPGLYRAADLVAVPSVRDRGGNVDGLPNVFLEALASGTPVVASRVAGIPDIGRDGETVALVPEADIDALGGTIAKLLQDHRRRAAIGAAARADAEARLGWDHVAARFEALYESVRR